MQPQLPEGYTIRNPTHDDIPAIIEVMRAFDIAEANEVDNYEPDDILRDWDHLDITKDAWLFFAPDGQPCGYAMVEDDDGGRWLADGYVHPAHKGRGIGSAILALTEARARELIAGVPEGTRQVLVNNILANHPVSVNLLESHSYELVRVFFRMRITMEGPQPAPAWPEGITMRLCDGSDENIRLAYETVEEAFKDHWGHPPRDFEDWHKHMVRKNFDRTLWFMAYEGEQIAGVALCRERDGDGWVTQLAVLRPWRKRGLGAALLHHAFNVFYERGMKRVGLGVDGQSLTGANRLYESVGMQVTERIGTYNKELRAGKDLLERVAP
jgi:mycothiol synthase